ncbi:hypothetical protein [Atlantibacter hermannii]|uniref:hypothetical protein n=1 Tax=Atlantibacter hermannii TaxID=565 RepID=UPI002897DE0B|nr:hypothetical protein [Atlantibacter hermannii]
MIITKVKFQTQHLFSSHEVTNFQVTASIAYVDGMEIDGTSNFQVPLGSSEKVIKEALKKAENTAFNVALDLTSTLIEDSKN